MFMERLWKFPRLWERWLWPWVSRAPSQDSARGEALPLLCTSVRTCTSEISFNSSSKSRNDSMENFLVPWVGKEGRALVCGVYCLIFVEAFPGS